MSHTKSISGFKKFSFTLLLVAMGIVPLVMRTYIYNPGLSAYSWFSDSNFSVDVFLHYKGVLLVAVAVFMTGVLIYGVVKHFPRFKGEIWLFPLIGYGILSLVSSLASPYRTFSFFGMYEQHETIWVLLAYCIVTVYSYYFIDDESSISLLIKILIFLAVIFSFIGLSQLIGKDFFESGIGRWLMVPEAVEEEYGFRETLVFSFSGSGNHQVYLTMYNPNYVGAYAALIFPIFATLAVSSKERGKKLFWAAMAVINFLSAMGAGSKTFIGSFAVSGIVAIVLYRKKLKKGWKLAASLAVIITVFTGVYFALIKTNPITYVKNAVAARENDSKLEHVELYDDRTEITYNGKKVNFSYEETENGADIKFFDGNKAELLYNKDEAGGTITLNDTAFDGLSFNLADSYEAGYIVICNTLKGSFNIKRSEKGYKFLNNVAKLDDIDYPPSAVFTGYDAFASGRGYIWSRTVPLLSKYLFLGLGADNFALAFPQSDYIGKLNGGFNGMIITKPHNIYMQVGVQTGVLSLICFLSVALIYVIQSLILYGKMEIDTVNKAVGAAVALGVIGYLVSGIFNDSCICVAPIYWCLLGAGYGINRCFKTEVNK